MKCQNCGTEFEEGLFCPECGTKWIENNINTNVLNSDSDQENEQALQKANAILEEYSHAEVEEEKIKHLGWNDSPNDAERIRIRMKQLEEAEKLELKTPLGQQKILDMKNDLRQDYLKVKKGAVPVLVSVVMAIVGTILCMYFLLPYGTVKKVIGIFIILGLLDYIYENWRDNKVIKEVEEFWQRENK